MSIFILCSLHLPEGILVPMERILRQCLWRDNIGTPNPKEKGGVGLVNFRKKNDALLMKHLDRFYNKANVPWVKLIWDTYYANGDVPHANNICGSFWWRDVFKLVDDFSAVAVIKPGHGDSFLFWKDSWSLNGISEPLSARFPRLFSYVLNDQLSAADVYATQDKSSLFYLPLSEQAHYEYQQLLSEIGSNPLSIDSDMWSY
jgi:hypothetical protein